MTVASITPWFGRLARKNSRRDAMPGGHAVGRSYRLSLDVLEDRTTPSTFTVTTGVDPIGRLVPGSLRWAITQANRPVNQNSTVEISSSVQNTISLRAGELRISSSMTIENASGRALTIQQTTPNSRIFHVLNNPRTTNVTIAGTNSGNSLTLTGGNVRNANGGAILVDNPKDFLTLNFVNVVGNSAAQVNNPKRGSKGNGGGIFSNGIVTLQNSTVAGNTAHGVNAASGHAGGTYTNQGITLVASHVDGNTARNAGGIFNVFGTVEVLQGSTVNNNASTADSFTAGDLGGGGIGQMDGNVWISASQVNNNRSAGMYSGGIVLLIGGVTVTDGSQVNGNSDNGPGGGIAANFGGAVVITNGSQVNGNTSGGIGGGIVNFSESFGTYVLNGSEVSDNTVTNVESFQNTIGLALLVQNQANQAPFASGGMGQPALAAALQLFLNVCLQRSAIITQAVNAFPDNPNVQVGGGIASPIAGPIVVNNGSIISGNHFVVTDPSQFAQGVGGGLFGNLGSITVDHSTISGNDASGNGGGIWNGHSLTITESTVRGNKSGGQGGGIFNHGTFTNHGSSIVDNTPDNVFPL